MPLTISQLFTPAPSGVGLDPNLTPPDGSWLALLLDSARILNFPTTAWQPGGPERTILAIAAVALSQEDVLISQADQGGFLDFAASGTVTYVGIDGQSTTQPVTPDPSIPSQNPTGALGWLDALGQSFYKVFRLLATYATGGLAIVNTTAGTLNYVAGNYHVANTNTGATYTNVDAFSLPPSALAGSGGVVTGVAIGSSTTTLTTSTAHGLAVNQIVFVNGTLGITGLNGAFAAVTGTPSATTFTIARTTSGTWTSGGQVYLCTVAQMNADIIGIASNAAAGNVTTTVSQANGVSVYNIGAWSASNYESNTAYVARIRLSLGARSPNGPSQAYEYFALTAQEILAAQSPPVLLTNGAIAKAITYSNPQTEVTYTIVASSSPASLVLGEPVTPGCAQLAITGATNATPIEITTATPHGLVSGSTTIIAGVLGNTAANGAGLATVTGASTFTVDSSVGNGAYTGGGTVEGGDLGQVDAIIQANSVPDGITAITQSALAFPVTIIATVVVPQAYLSTYQAAAPIALQALIATFPIGGFVPPGGTIGTIPYSAVSGALIDAGVLTPGAVSYVRQVSSLTVNGGVIDLNYPTANHEAQVVAPTISVVGV